TLKYPLIFSFIDTRPGVFDLNTRIIALLLDLHPDVSLFGTVFTGITNQVLQQNTQCKFLPLYYCRLAIQLDILLSVGNFRIQARNNLLRQFMQVDQIEAGTELIRTGAVKQ